MIGITQAWAQDATTAATDIGGAASTGSSWGSMVPLLLIFAVFYFLLIRPQQKRLKEHAAMVTALRRHDKVVTSGGILGTITKVEDEAGILHIEIAPEVVIRVKRDTVTERISSSEDVSKKTTPDTPKKKKKGKETVEEDTKEISNS